MTLQALSESNRRLWLEAMDGKEPVRNSCLLSLESGLLLLFVPWFFLLFFFLTFSKTAGASGSYVGPLFWWDPVILRNRDLNSPLMLKIGWFTRSGCKINKYINESSRGKKNSVIDVFFFAGLFRDFN